MMTGGAPMTQETTICFYDFFVWRWTRTDLSQAEHREIQRIILSQSFPVCQWIGLRENLQETMVFTIEIHPNVAVSGCPTSIFPYPNPMRLSLTHKNLCSVLRPHRSQPLPKSKSCASLAAVAQGKAPAILLGSPRAGAPTACSNT